MDDKESKNIRKRFLAFYEKQNIDRLIFMICLFIVFFALGYISHARQYFPYKFLQRATLAYHALLQVVNPDPDTEDPAIIFWDETGIKKPMANTLSPKAGQEAIFMIGNEFAHLELCPDTGCLAWVLNRSGKILHVWKNPSEVWVSPEKYTLFPGWSVYPTGGYLYPNGDILVSYQGRDMFPALAGLAKFDKDSNLIWKRSDYHHHWFGLDEKGQIYIPGAKMIFDSYSLKGYKQGLTCPDDVFYYEPIVILSPDGTKIEEIDLYKSLMDSGLAGMIDNERIPTKCVTCDPIHLNDIRILSEEKALEFPGLNAGDLLVSLRSVNMIGVIDSVSTRFTWSHVGSHYAQHSPRFYKNGRILVFDNLGGAAEKGTSRVLGIDMNTREEEPIFPREGVPVPDRDIYSKTAGHLDVLSDADRMLVSWTHQGLVYEIDILTGEVLWEYVNTHPVEDKFGRIPIYTSLYVDLGDLRFDLNHGQLP